MHVKCEHMSFYNVITVIPLYLSVKIVSVVCAICVKYVIGAMECINAW